MRKRIICLLLVLTLAVGAFPVVSAAEHGMEDIVGHWAEKYIVRALDMGLFSGTSASTFSPQGTMTRAMFVTVLARYAGVDPDEFEDWYLPELYKDVPGDSWCAPYINWAARHGITSGTSATTFGPNLAISREQMALLLLRFVESYGYVFEQIREDVPDSFADEELISPVAMDAVNALRACGLISGRKNPDGSYSFDPKALLTRAECATIFCSMMSALVIDEDFFFEEPEEIAVFGHEGIDLLPGDSIRLEYMTIPERPTNDTILWISSDPSVVSVDQNGVITCNGSGEAEIYAYTCNGCFDYAVISVDYYIGYYGESYASKCMHLFGEVVDNHRRPYGDDAPKSAYEEHYETVTVKVWDFKDKNQTEKVTKTRSFYVHENLVPTIKRVFQEIYECEEQYPINSIISYWSTGGNSEHNPGTAIDINYLSNPYVDPNGKVITGEKFDPENDPYSIPVGGEVEQIFEKYGFTRGIYWKSGYKDYMHFSFFGT
ncbi:MAG: S-layer homology domain-containing protein [Oscillospiraceae bacterium]|nr:S-layer homology domain-containing protein [Oscillospiraceae bacterium]